MGAHLTHPRSANRRRPGSPPTPPPFGTMPKDNQTNGKGAVPTVDTTGCSVARPSRARTRKSSRIATRQATAVANIGEGRRNPATPLPKVVRWMSRMSWMSRTCPPLPWLCPRTRRMATHLHLRGQGNFLWPNLIGQGGGAGGITQGRGRSAAAGYVASAHTAARDGLFEDVAVDEGPM